MKLREIIDEAFDADYYDYLQDEMRIRKGTEDAERAHNDSAAGTSAGDFIVSAYEVGKISYDQALKELRFQLKDDPMELEFWSMELNSARELREE